MTPITWRATRRASTGCARGYAPGRPGARQVMSKRVGLAADEEKFRLQEDARSGELHAPIVNGSAAIALLIDDRGGRGAIAQAAVGSDPVERRGCSAAVTIAHLVEPQILGMLEEGDERLTQER